MTVAIDRFQFLNEETNVGISDFTSSDNTAILNSASNALQGISDEVSAFLGDGVADANDLIVEVSEAGDELVREVKDAASDLVDLKDSTIAQLSSKMRSLADGNPIATSVLDSMSLDCKALAGSKKNKEQNFGSEIDCNGDKRSAEGNCSVEAFGSALSTMTGGLFSFAYTDLDGLMDRILSLASMGYSLNLCGVFAALSSGVDTNLLSKASSSLLSGLNKNGDLLGVLDLASSSVGLHAGLFQNEIAKNTLNSLKIPSNAKEVEFSSLMDRTTGALDIFDDGWTASSTVDLTMPEVTNIDTATLLRAKLMDSSYTPSELDTAPNNDELYMYAAIS